MKQKLCTPFTKIWERRSMKNITFLYGAGVQRLYKGEKKIMSESSTTGRIIVVIKIKHTHAYIGADKVDLEAYTFIIVYTLYKQEGYLKK